MSSNVIEPSKKEKEVEELYQFRFSNFVEILGPDWPLDDIHALVESDISRHDLEKLLERGCSKQLALRILL